MPHRRGWARGARERAPPETACGSPGREHARHGWLRSALGNSRGRYSDADYPADRATTGERCPARLHARGGRLHREAVQPDGTGGAGEAAAGAMTLEEASPFTQAAFHAAGALCVVCLAFLLLLQIGRAHV